MRDESEWQPLATKPPWTTVEERGIYEEDAGLFYFRATHWRPLNGRTERRGIYIVSKIRHAERWKELRIAGFHIVSTWIDEAGPGESSDLNDLWRRCLREVSHCQVLIAYREKGEILKGGWVEIGAALSSGIPVYAVGLDGFTIASYRGVRVFKNLESALIAASELV